MNKIVESNYMNKIVNPNYQDPIPKQSNIKIIDSIGWGFGKWLAFFIIWMMISQYIIQKLEAASNSEIFTSWWKSRNGNIYSKVFDVDQLNEFSKPSWIFWIDNLFRSESKDSFSNNQSKFLNQYVMQHMFIQSSNGSLNQGNFTNYLWPRHLCQSILFKKGEDYYYDQYLSSGNKDSWPTTPKEWQQRITQWCDNNIIWQKPKDGGKLLVPTPKTGTINGWTRMSANKNTLYHVDNVFARYGINFDSSLIVSLGNGIDTSNPTGGIDLKYSAAMALVGLDAQGNPVDGDKYPGGWVGFLQETGNTNPSDYLYTSLNTKASDPPKTSDTGQKCKTSDKTGAWLSGAGTAASIGIMAAMGPGGWATIGILGVAAAAGAISGVSSANSHGCL